MHEQNITDAEASRYIDECPLTHARDRMERSYAPFLAAHMAAIVHLESQLAESMAHAIVSDFPGGAGALVGLMQKSHAVAVGAPEPRPLSEPAATVEATRLVKGILTRRLAQKESLINWKGERVTYEQISRHREEYQHLFTSDLAGALLDELPISDVDLAELYEGTRHVSPVIN